MAKRKIELLTPAMNHYEHDPRQWWQTTYETIGEALGAGVLAMAAVQSQLYQQLRQINADLDQLRTNQNA